MDVILKNSLLKERQKCINKLYVIQQLEKLYKLRKPYKKKKRKMKKL